MNDTRITSHTQKRPTIFVSGPSSSCDADTAGKGRALGHAIARGQAILLTGTGNGFARYVAEGAMSEGGMVIGLSPASNSEEHTSLYGLSTLYHDTIIYTGFGYAGRDMLLSRSADAMIVGSGDVAHAYDIMLLLHEKKPCGVLEGPWLLDDTLKELFTRSGRTRERMVFSPDSETLVTHILEEIRMTRMRA